MKNIFTLEQSIQTIKELFNSLSPTEKEQFRDELLSWLLFDGKCRNNLKGLSEKDKELIERLAKQTERLYWLMRGSGE